MQFVNTIKPEVFISIVSHSHGEMIKELNCLNSLSKKFNVVIKNNCNDYTLKEYCENNNICIIDEDYFQGFGYNNNSVYNYCVEELNMKPDDFFIVLNPDLVVSVETIEQLVKNMIGQSDQVATINLYKDDLLTIHDNSIRRFPRLSDFFCSLLFGKNDTKINKSMIRKPIHIDWCAGSFIAFSSAAFKKVLGFDIGYFMYCEDVDICYRLKFNNFKVTYYPDLTAVHKAQHKNRAVFSMHFVWHVKSAIRFILVKYKLRKNKTNIH